MKANIRLISGKSDTSRELIFENIEELESHLKYLHQGDPQGWIIYSIEEEDTNWWFHKMDCKYNIYLDAY